MDVQAYIASGILELYVLGQLSPEEEQQVIDYASQYPEIREEIDAIELSLESFAKLNAVTPPADVLDGIKSRIGSTATPPPPATNPPSPGNNSFGRWSSLGLALLAVGTLWYFFQYRQANKELEDVKQQYQELQDSCTRTDLLNLVLNRQLAIYRAPSVQNFILRGTDHAPNIVAQVLFNPDTETTHFSVGTLPPPPPGKQYQLWALIDGEPIDMGVIELTALPDRLVPVTHVSGAQVFAVTLEDLGGHPTPNLDELYAIS